MTSNEIFLFFISFLPFAIQVISRKFISFAIFGVIAVFLHGSYLFGPNIIILLLVTYIISTIAELTALKTPIQCFGVKYWYDLKHKFFASRVFLGGVYPIEISFAWIMIKYVSFCLGILISTAFSLPKFMEILLIPLILVSADFIIDPVSVNIKKLWRWERGTKYFGIPWENFLGWYVVGLVSTLIFNTIDNTESIKFNNLFLLPIFFYGFVLNNFPILYKQNKKLAIIGSLPAFVWTVLGLLSLYILYLRGIFV